MNLRVLRTAYRRCWKLNTAIADLADTVADLDDPISDHLLQRVAQPAAQLGQHLHVLRDSEQAARGLGDPALTGSAQDGADESRAGEPVGRGRTKTRLRT